jgi:hypothetical protein
MPLIKFIHRTTAERIIHNPPVAEHQRNNAVLFIHESSLYRDRQHTRENFQLCVELPLAMLERRSRSLSGFALSAKYIDPDK